MAPTDRERERERERTRIGALASLVPEVNWQQIIEERKRAKPERYGDYVPH